MKYYGFIILGLFLLASISGVSAQRLVYNTHIDIGSHFTAHQGDFKNIKVEFWGDDDGIFGSDSYLAHANLHYEVSRGNEYYRAGDLVTNWLGNAYFNIDTRDLDPGEYDIVIRYYGGPGQFNSYYNHSSKSSKLTVMSR